MSCHVIQTSMYFITEDISIDVILVAMSTYHVGSMLHLHRHESSRASCHFSSRASNIMLAPHKSHVMQLLRAFAAVELKSYNAILAPPL